MKKILGRSLIDLETLQTVTTEIENILNDRPLTYISSDISDDEPLTPAHLLYGRRITCLPYLQKTDLDSSTCANMDFSNISDRNKRQCLLLQHFWNRWKNEYLVALREYHVKNGRNTINVKPGDVVQIEEDNKSRISWKIAVIEEVIQGNDNIPRSALLRTAKGRTTRPLAKLYPLEVCDEQMNESEDTTNQRTCSVRSASMRAREKIKKWTNS